MSTPHADAILVVGTGYKTIADGLHILYGQGQTFCAQTDAGLVVIDSGPGGSVTQSMIDSARAISDEPVHAVCYSHGHIGYNTGIGQWLADAAARGHPAPRVIAHANVLRRYARYRETHELQQRMAEVQFKREPGFFEKRILLHDPDETFDDRLVIGEGDRRVELFWAPSETDDAIAAWCPAQRVLYGGPSLLDSIPNVGTPFRTLRDPVRWADTLDAMAALRPLIAVREFGGMIEGEANVRQVLGHTARALRWLRAAVVSLINRGLNERQVLEAVAYPPELFDVEWMKPTYGDPSYIVRDIYRSENGWWDRNPTTLHPSSPSAAQKAIEAAIADKRHVIDCAQRHADAGDLQLALHVIDLLAGLHTDSDEAAQARSLKARWLRERAGQTRSYVSKNLYHAGADVLEGKAENRLGIG
ncbi:MAG: alkyl sulfatase dimerization domain-containing protein [Burkholderiaceae bacterium]